MDLPVALFASDPAILSALHFALSLDGFDVRDGATMGDRSACLIVDQYFPDDGLSRLSRLRASGNMGPAILLVTHADRKVRASAAMLGASIIDKPLTGEDLTAALTKILSLRPAA